MCRTAQQAHGTMVLMPSQHHTQALHKHCVPMGGMVHVWRIEQQAHTTEVLTSRRPYLSTVYMGVSRSGVVCSVSSCLKKSRKPSTLKNSWLVMESLWGESTAAGRVESCWAGMWSLAGRKCAGGW